MRQRLQSQGQNPTSPGSGGDVEDTAGMEQQDMLVLLSVYLAAIIHDFDHRGLTNPFLIQDEDPLAVSYGGGVLR